MWLIDRLPFFATMGGNSDKRTFLHIEKLSGLALIAALSLIDNKIKKGIIWHTQGSGKTALAYFNVHYLKDYYQKKNIIAKFYFITDRLDLATQAKNEFENQKLSELRDWLLPMLMNGQVLVN